MTLYIAAQAGPAIIVILCACCVCVRVFVKLCMKTQTGPVILVILCVYTYLCMKVCDGKLQLRAAS